MSIEVLAMQALGLITLFLALGCALERVMKKPTDGCTRQQATRNTQPKTN